MIQKQGGLIHVEHLYIILGRCLFYAVFSVFLREYIYMPRMLYAKKTPRYTKGNKRNKKEKRQKKDKKVAQ